MTSLKTAAMKSRSPLERAFVIGHALRRPAPLEDALALAWQKMARSEGHRTSVWPKLSGAVMPDAGVAERRQRALELYADGLTRDEIAKRLGYSTYAVQNDLRGVRRKAGARP